MNAELIELRELEERDTANIVRWRNDDEVRRNLFTQTLLTEEQHLRYFHTVVQSGRCRQYIIILKDTSPVDIGTVFLKNIDAELNQAEFGIFIGEPQGRGKRISFPATNATLQIAFESMGLRRVYLSVVGDNIPAIKTYLRIGFHEYDRETEAFPRNGHSVDIIHMEITKEQWECEQRGKN